MSSELGRCVNLTIESLSHIALALDQINARQEAEEERLKLGHVQWLRISSFDHLNKEQGVVFRKVLKGLYSEGRRYFDPRLPLRYWKHRDIGGLTLTVHERCLWRAGIRKLERHGHG